MVVNRVGGRSTQRDDCHKLIPAVPTGNYNDRTLFYHLGLFKPSEIADKQGPGVREKHNGHRVEEYPMVDELSSFLLDVPLKWNLTFN